MAIDTTRPNGYKGTTAPKKPVDISPRAVNKVRRKAINTPVDISRPLVAGRKTFFTEEDVTMGHLAGPHALKGMILDAHNECLSIHNEMMGIIERYIPKEEHRSWQYIHIMTEFECAPSPVGLCVYDFLKDPAGEECLFCKQGRNR